MNALQWNIGQESKTNKEITVFKSILQLNTVIFYVRLYSNSKNEIYANLSNIQVCLCRDFCVSQDIGGRHIFYIPTDANAVSSEKNAQKKGVTEVTP